MQKVTQLFRVAHVSRKPVVIVGLTSFVYWEQQQMIFVNPPFIMNGACLNDLLYGGMLRRPGQEILAV